MRSQNPLELVNQDISTCDAKNPIVGLLLHELDLGKKDAASDFIKKAPKLPGVYFIIKNRLNKHRNDRNNNDNGYVSPPPSASPYNF